MDKLWCFGDSFTAGHGCKYQFDSNFSNDNENSHYFKMYKDYIDSNKKIWPEIVSYNLGLELVSTIAKVGIFNLLASARAICSFWISTMKIAAG